MSDVEGCCNECLIRVRIAMPKHEWPLTFDEIATITNAWPRASDGALVTWAMWAADGLDYLLDVDDQTFGHWPRRLHGYPHEAVDLAHVRWAAASAITTLDLCAGTLGRRRCPPRHDGNEYSLRDFDAKYSKAVQRLALLTSPERAWAVAAHDRSRLRHGSQCPASDGP